VHKIRQLETYQAYLDSAILARYKNNDKQKFSEALRFFVENQEKRYTAMILALDKIVDNAQCIVFYMVKHKGNLPPGFEMDERVRLRALEPIHVEGSYDALHTGLAKEKMTATKNWLEFLEQEFTALTIPTMPTYGIF
jgi:hypothetical protein